MPAHEPSERPARGRADQVADWIGWHLLELVAVGVPAALALAVAWWLIGVSVLAGAAWAAAEVRTTRRAALPSPDPTPELDTARTDQAARTACDEESA